MTRLLRSPVGPVLVIAFAIAASVVRWLIQDSHNLYTAVEKRFYVPDPDLGWRISTQHPVWLGLEIIGVMVGIVVAIAVAGLIVRRRPRLRRGVIAGAWLVAVACVTVPILAFASGPGPLHGEDNLPARAAVAIESGIAGKLDAAAGSYVVVKHEGTAVTAHLSAGGESFDARFGDVTGSWRGDRRDLSADSHGTVSVGAASVDTGVGERSKHAREKYLFVDKYPQISVAIEGVEAVRQSSPTEVAFRAKGTAHLMDKTHVVDIVGTLAKPDAAALQRLGLAGDVLLVQADFSLVIAESALAPDAHDFDGERFPIHVSRLPEKPMKKLFVSLAIVVAAVACTKKEDKPSPVASGSGSGSAAAPAPTPTPPPSNGSGSGSGSGSAAGSAVSDPNADHVTVFSHHLKAQPKDPVKLEFAKFKVVKATLDPKKPEGGTATIELDLTSFKTDSDKRDTHVKSAAFLDTDKAATATITVDHVKAKSGSTYSAEASVVAHGITKKFPVTFDVLETADDHIKIKATHEFSRLDFGVGSDPAKDAEQQVATDLKIEMVLTIPKG